MACYNLLSKHFSRSRGSKVTRAAAYRAGERIADQRSGEVYNHTHRNDIRYKEVLLPEDLASRPEMRWAYQREILWNAVEKAGKRKDASLARELMVVVPPELTEGQRVALVRRFGAELATRYRTAVDVCLHLPRPQSHQDNHHAHLLMSTREVGPRGCGQRTTLEVQGRDRRRRGLQNSQKAEFMGVRERWAQLVNEALRDAGLDVRVDPRSLAAQGINREPSPHLPPAVIYLERRNGPCAAGNAIRHQHAERVAARQQGPEALAQVMERQKLERIEHAKAKEAQPPGPRRRAMTPQGRKALEHEPLDTPERVPEGLAGGRTGLHDQASHEVQSNRKNNREGNRDVVHRACVKPGQSAQELRPSPQECRARREAEARRERWAALEAQRVMELRRAEEARKPVPAAARELGLERAAPVRECGTEESKDAVFNDGFDLEL